MQTYEQFMESVVIDFLEKNDGNQVSHQAIADRLGCHRNTARVVVKRLENEGRIVCLRGTFRGGGYRYQVNDETGS